MTDTSHQLALKLATQDALQKALDMPSLALKDIAPTATGRRKITHVWKTTLLNGSTAVVKLLPANPFSVISRDGFRTTPALTSADEAVSSATIAAWKTFLRSPFPEAGEEEQLIVPKHLAVIYPDLLNASGNAMVYYPGAIQNAPNIHERRLSEVKEALVNASIHDQKYPGQTRILIQEMLPGAAASTPTIPHCAELGKTLATLHNKGSRIITKGDTCSIEKTLLNPLYTYVDKCRKNADAIVGGNTNNTLHFQRAQTMDNTFGEISQALPSYAKLPAIQNFVQKSLVAQSSMPFTRASTYAHNNPSNNDNTGFIPYCTLKYLETADGKAELIRTVCDHLLNTHRELCTRVMLDSKPHGSAKFLPSTVTHGDPTLGNVLFQDVNGEPKITGILDWDGARITAGIKDIGTAIEGFCTSRVQSTATTGNTTEHINSLAVGKEQDLDSIKAFVNAYHAVRPLTAIEASLIPHMVLTSFYSRAAEACGKMMNANPHDVEYRLPLKWMLALQNNWQILDNKAFIQACTPDALLQGKKYPHVVDHTADDLAYNQWWLENNTLGIETQRAELLQTACAHSM